MGQRNLGMKTPEISKRGRQLQLKNFRESDVLAVEYFESQNRRYLGIKTPEIPRS